MAAILKSAIMDSAILNKKNFTHSFWLNMMLAAILNSAILESDTSILDSDTLFSSLRFTQKHSHSILTLTQTNTIWLKLIHSHLTWWWQSSWILPCWIQTLCFLLWDSLKNTLSPFWLWLKLIQSDSFILTQIDRDSNFESANLHSSILVYPLKLTHTCQDWFPLFGQKKNPSLIHSDSTWWWQTSWTLPYWIQPFCTKKNFTNSFWLNLMMAAILNSAMLDSDTAILDSAILQKKNFTHSFSLNMMLAAILNSAMLGSDTAILDSGTLFSSLRFTQKHSHSILTLIETNTIWLKLIHSHLTWWWQSSWILLCWIQTPHFLLSETLKNTLTPLWLWLKLIQSDSFIITQIDRDSNFESANLHSAILVFPLKLTHTCQDWFPLFGQKKPSLIHSDSSWW